MEDYLIKIADKSGINILGPFLLCYSIVITFIFIAYRSVAINGFKKINDAYRELASSHRRHSLELYKTIDEYGKLITYWQQQYKAEKENKEVK